jgi:hypothetical protein
LKKRIETLFPWLFSTCKNNKKSDDICLYPTSYIGNGLDVYRSAAPTLRANSYTSLRVPGLGGAPLAFDIQKVNSGRVENMEKSDVIVFGSGVNEEEACAAIFSRLSVLEKARICSFCRQRRCCSVNCEQCRQIFYCSESCRANDQRRHSNFCSLSLRDML